MADRSRFDTLARQYAAARPDYPAELYDALAGILGRALAGVDVIDLGAGTGIATRQLAERGARVVAVELSAPMLAELVSRSPAIPAVRGSGHALPLRDGSADLVTCAQAWHWIDPRRAVPEWRRVLRPGGVFAAWWNDQSPHSVWEGEQAARLDALRPDWRAVASGGRRDEDDLPAEYGLRVTRCERAFDLVLGLTYRHAGANSVRNVGNRSVKRPSGEPGKAPERLHTRSYGGVSATQPGSSIGRFTPKTRSNAL